MYSKEDFIRSYMDSIILPVPSNPDLRKKIIFWPVDLLDRIREISKKNDENVSTFIRRIIAREVGWKGPTNNITGYRRGTYET